MFHTCTELVLASASPRRQQFVRDLGLRCTLAIAPGDEARPMPGEEPAAYASRTAQAKALAVAALHPHAVILAADTIVVLDGDILGKPVDDADSLAMLIRLSGRSHTVITAVCLIFPAEQATETFSVSSTVRFHTWPHAVLAAYAASGEPRDKAGAYAVQGLGSFLVEAIDGSWTSVVGLPIAELAERLLAHGVIRTS